MNTSNTGHNAFIRTMERNQIKYHTIGIARITNFRVWIYTEHKRDGWLNFPLIELEERKEAEYGE